MMEGPDLIKYAKEKASEGVDLFALLGIDATTSPDDIHKAWRRTALKHHPDKAGAHYDAELYESFGRARDVLVDPEAREAYNKVVSAALQKKAQLEQMGSRRRQLVEDLERREAEARGAKKARTEQHSMHDPERAAMAARGRAKMEERKRLIREAEERERLRKLERQKQEETEEPNAAPAAESAPAQERPSPAAAAEGAAPTPPAGGGPHDEYDERIADLERRIRERKEEKLRRKEDKKARKAGTAPQPEVLGADEQPRPAGAAKEPPQKPPAPSDDGPKADAHSSRPTSADPPQPGGPSSNGSPFASTMARLRAAQARKDEEKRKAAAA